MADNDDTNEPLQELLAPSPQRLPDIPLPPSGMFRLVIATIIRYGGVQRAYESYERALAARRDALEAFGGMKEAEIELRRSARRLQDLETILDTDTDLRAEARADAAADLEIGGLRRKRELLEEEMRLAKTEKKFEEFKEGQKSPGHDDEEVQAFMEALNRELFTPEKIRKATDQLIDKHIEECGGKDNLTDEDQAWIRQVRAFEEKWLSETRDDG